MSVAGWNERKVVPSIRVIPSKDNSRRVFIERVEHYTRSDISCGSCLCSHNCRVRDALRDDIGLYLFPSAVCVDRYIDFFENETVLARHGVVLCVSELHKLPHRALRLRSRVRSLYRDRRKNVYLFDDVHHDKHGVMGPLGAAGWYQRHLPGLKCLVLVDDDDQDRGTSCVNIEEYVQSEWGHDEEIVNLFTAGQESRKVNNASSCSHENGATLTSAQIERGIARGVYLKGILNVETRRSARSSVVKHDGSVVHMMTRKDRWHAIHGDEVVVELVSGESTSSCVDDEMSDMFSSLADEDFRDDAVQQRGKVIHVVQRRHTDIMVAISKEDEKALLMLGSSESMNSVICVPFDHRFPKLRVKSRHLDTYIGKRFLVRIIGWDEDSSYPHAHILKCMGPMGDLKTETDVLLHRHGLLFGEFSQGALQELPSSSQQKWVPGDDEMQGNINRSRLDLRDAFVYSIDPEGCTDVDDAMHVRCIDKDTFELGIHIADVTYFVKDASYLEEEAASRCTTVYLVDRRLDMLPSQISENAASLLSGQPRYAVSVVWKIAYDGFRVLDTWYGRSIIYSRYQLEYSQAQAILDGKSHKNDRLCGLRSHEDVAQVRQGLEIVQKLAEYRLRSRLKSGAIDLDSKELKFETDEAGMPQQIHEKQSLDTMKIIAELMIMANEAVAKKICQSHPTSAVLRCHAYPDKDKLENMHAFCRKCSIGNKDMFIQPQAFGKDLQDALVSIQDPALKSLLKNVANMSLQQAVYTTAGGLQSRLHAGLGLHNGYTHFTSPIRRYADIIVHKQLLESIAQDEEQKHVPRDLDSRISTVNQKTRAAKICQRECSLLYLLLLFAKSPKRFEAIVEDFQQSFIRIFVPQVDLRGVIRLDSSDKRSAALSLLFPSSEIEHISVEVSEEGESISFKDTLSNTSVSLGRMNTLWVRLESEISSFHGPSLLIRILPDKFTHEDSMRPTTRVGRMAGMCSSSLPDEPANDSDNESQVPEITDLTSALLHLTISKMNMDKELRAGPLASSSISVTPTVSQRYTRSVGKELEQAIQKLAEKARIYTMRARKCHPGSEKYEYWTRKANAAVANHTTIVHSLFWDSKQAY